MFLSGTFVYKTSSSGELLRTAVALPDSLFQVISQGSLKNQAALSGFLHQCMKQRLFNTYFLQASHSHFEPPNNSQEQISRSRMILYQE